MSKLEKLIEELCPNGVEYVATKDIKKESFWLMPSTPAYIDSGVPYITSKNIKNGVIDFDNVKYISENDFEIVSSNRKIEENDMLITMIGTIGEVETFRKAGESKGLYEVRTRKILLISNAIASSSTIINASITNNPKNLDIGSLLNTVTHLFGDVRFNAKIKQEFIESIISDRVKVEIDEIDRMFEAI